MDSFYLGLSAIISVTAMIFIVFFYLYLTYRESYIRYWTVGWGFLAVYLVSQFFFVNQNIENPYFLINLASGILGSTFILQGTLLFSEKKRSLLLLSAGFLITASIIALRFFYDYYQLLPIPVYFYTGCLFILTGLVLFTNSRIKGFIKFAAGLIFLLMGVNLFNNYMMWHLYYINKYLPVINLILTLTGPVLLLPLYFQLSSELVKYRQKLLRIFLEQSSEGIYRIDFTESIPINLPSEKQLELFFQTGFIAESNLSSAAAYGYDSINEFIGKKISDIHLTNDDSNIRELTGFIDSGYRAKDIETVEYDKDKNIKYFNNSFLGIIEKGRLTGIWGMQRDNTDRKIILDSLLESERKFHALFQNASDALYLWEMQGDKIGRLLEANNKACEMMEYSRKELLEMSYDQLNDPESMDILLPIVEKLRKGVAVNIELSHKTKSGKMIPVEINAHSFIFNRTKFVLAIVRDITIRKETEKALIRAKEEAEKSSSLKSEFLALMSHEVRTPINSILSIISFFKEDTELVLPKEIRDGFAVIERGSKRLVRTMDLILNLSQIQSGNYNPNFEKLVLLELLEEKYLEFNTVAKEKNLDFKLINNASSTIIRGDLYTISQAFTNLIDNAIKYTSQGDVIIRIKDYTKSRIIVEIDDSGIGMAKEYVEIMFSPFSQEESGHTRKYDGNGIGLALTKKYCEINNVEISVESEKGKGTKFSLIFNML